MTLRRRKSRDTSGDFVDGNPLRVTVPVYTDEDRARLLAPITINHIGGKSHAGSTSERQLVRGRGHVSDDTTEYRYAQRADWADLDRIE